MGKAPWEEVVPVVVEGQIHHQWVKFGAWLPHLLAPEGEEEELVQ